jgi:hypothetical protein
MRKKRVRGYVLAETLLALLLLSLLFIQSAAMLYPLVTGSYQTQSYTEAGYAGLSVLECLRQDTFVAYGASEVSTWLPWTHDFQIMLLREPFAGLTGMDQYTVRVFQGEKELARLTTLRAG